MKTLALQNGGTIPHSNYHCRQQSQHYGTL